MDEINNISGPICLKNKIAIVTGAARGIGRAIAFALAREEAIVVSCDILASRDNTEDIRKTDQRQLSYMCDVSKKTEVQITIDKVMTEWGRIDILVNNAAMLGDYGKPIEEFTLEEWERLINVNLRGAFLMTQAVWPHMKRQNGGKIICIGSIAGKIGGILAGPHYCASKGGIHSLVKWGAKHGAGIGIYVNGIAPGPIVTDMTVNEPLLKEIKVPIGRLGQPEDIAEAVVFLASQASNFITGIILDVNGGLLMA